MRTQHKILPRYFEKTDLGNGHCGVVRGIELEITTITADDHGPDTSTIQGFWMTLPQAAALSTSIGNLLIGRAF